MEFRSQAPAASARPDIISLDVLLRDVDEGRVQIPRFQRPYVWSPQMMRELFQSVLSGYPIGSLLFWEPRDSGIRVMDRIGPLPAPPSPKGSVVSLVLDGHQRLATLYGVLRLGEKPTLDLPSAEELSWRIGYDLEREEARQMRPEDAKDSRVLPLQAVLKTGEFVKFARAIDADASLSDTLKAKYLDRADAVQRAIRDYRIALTIMRDGDVNDAVAIFSKINRSGRAMTSDQMAVALTYHDDFSLEDALDEILGQLEPFGFGDVSRTIILQSLLHGAKRNFVKPNFDNLRDQRTREALKAAVQPVMESLRDAARFLNEKIGFHTGRLLPYAHQIFLLGVFFRRAQSRAKQQRGEPALVRWFWATSFEGWFASANSSDIELAANAIEAFAESEMDETAKEALDVVFVDRPLRPFPKTFDRRSARIRAMLLVQMARGPLLDPVSGDEIDGSDLMADPDRRDLPYVYRPAGNPSSRSPANRILLPRKYGSAVRDVLVEHVGAEAALASHAIGTKGIEALLSKSVDDFVEARERELVRQEAKFLDQFGLKVSDELARSNEEVDIDD